MKKVGLPFTLLRTPLRKSSWDPIGMDVLGKLLVEQIEIQVESVRVGTELIV